MLQVLQAGISTPEHQDYLARHHWYLHKSEAALRFESVRGIRVRVPLKVEYEYGNSGSQGALLFRTLVFSEKYEKRHPEDGCLPIACAS